MQLGSWHFAGREIQPANYADHTDWLMFRTSENRPFLCLKLLAELVLH